MSKSISDNQKKSRGRPATGITPMVGVRLQPGFRAEIQTWADNQEDKPALAEAIRRLIRQGLDKPKAREVSLAAAKPARGIKAKPLRKAPPPERRT
jgi:hypothetical protein